MMTIYATTEEWAALVMLACQSPNSSLWRQAGHIVTRAAVLNA